MSTDPAAPTTPGPARGPAGGGPVATIAPPGADRCVVSPRSGASGPDPADIGSTPGDAPAHGRPDDGGPAGQRPAGNRPTDSTHDRPTGSAHDQPTGSAHERADPTTARREHAADLPLRAPAAVAATTARMPPTYPRRDTGVRRLPRPPATPDLEALISAALAETAETARAILPDAPAPGPRPTTPVTGPATGTRTFGLYAGAEATR